MSFLEDSKPVWNFYPIANAPIAVEASFDWRRFQTTDFNAHKILMPSAARKTKIVQCSLFAHPSLSGLLEQIS